MKNEIAKAAATWYLPQYFIIVVLSLFLFIMGLTIMRQLYPVTAITINADEGTILKSEKYIKLINTIPIIPDNLSD